MSRRQVLRIIVSALLATGLTLALLSQASAAPSGTLFWARRYDGGIGRDDVAVDAARDRWGNVIVVGWQDNSTAPGVVAYDVLVAKYRPNGARQWVRRFDGPAHRDDMGRAVAVDRAGYIYVAASSEDAVGASDYWTLKLTPSGGLYFSRRWNGLGGTADEPADIAVDGGTNVIVTGVSASGAAAGDDMATIKYDPSGALMWATSYNGPASATDAGIALTVDTAHRVYVAGKSRNGGGNDDWVAVKYTDAGAPLWVKRFNGTRNTHDVPVAIGLDRYACVYVAGSAGVAGPTRGSADMAVLKFKPTGTFVWARYYDGPLSAERDEARALAIDRAGYVIMCGFSPRYGARNDFVTLKYTLSGARVWARRFDGPSHRDDIARSVAAGPSGSVYVTGSSYRASSGDDYATVKYTPAGALAWVRRYHRSTLEGDHAFKVVTDAASVFVTGASYNGSGDEHEDMATLRYAP